MQSKQAIYCQALLKESWSSFQAISGLCRLHGLKTAMKSLSPVSLILRAKPVRRANFLRERGQNRCQGAGLSVRKQVGCVDLAERVGRVGRVGQTAQEGKEGAFVENPFAWAKGRKRANWEGKGEHVVQRLVMQDLSQSDGNASGRQKRLKG